MSRSVASPTFASIALASALLELRIMRLREARVGSSRASFPRSACTNAPSRIAIFGRLAAYIISSPLSIARPGVSAFDRSTRATAKRR